MSRTIRYVDGDIYVPRSTGRPVYVEGLEKAEQDVAYQLTTEYDPNTGQGSELSSIDTPVYATTNIIQSLISTKISEAITRLKRLQYNRLDQIPKTELIKRIISNQVWKYKNLDFAFYVAIETESLQKITKTWLVKLGHQLPDSLLRKNQELQGIK